MLGNAATGVVFPIFIIAQAFAWWIGDGCAAYLNICQGRGDAENSRKADGAPGWSMASMLSGALVNIALDPAFIYGCKWGMAGAAWATVIGQCV